MRSHLKALLALMLCFMLTTFPVMQGFAEGAEEPQVAQTAEATATPTAEATAEVTSAPSVEATAEVTAAPTGEATAEVTAEPTAEATAEVTAEPTGEATAEVTAAPTGEATAEVTAAPTGEATAEATAAPTAEATAEATAAPGIEPAQAFAILADDSAFTLAKDDAAMTAVVTGYDDTTEKDVVIPVTIDGYDIVGIGNSAFAGKSVTSVVIPLSVTSIGTSAFQNCASLANVTLVSGLGTIGGSAFAGTAIATILIPGSVTAIGDGAFADCGSLATVTLGSSLETLGDGAFMGCTDLTSITFGAGLKEVGTGAFSGCTALVTATLKSGVETISDSAFSGCTALDQLVLPYDTLTYVGANSFAGCPLTANLFVYSIKNSEVAIERYTGSSTAVVIPDEVGGKYLTTISAAAFLGKTDVTKITLGASVRRIGASAFTGLGNLVEFGMNDMVNTIGANAFKDCDSLTAIALPDSLLEIGANAFEGCAALGAITLPGYLTTIGARAFADTAITQFEIPASVSALPSDAFDGCNIDQMAVDAANSTYMSIDHLLYSIATRTLMRAYGTETSIDVPTSTQAIGARAFADRMLLKVVTLPTSVVAIGNEAFASCTALETVTIPSSVVAIGDNAFQGCPKLTVRVFSNTSYAYVYCTNESIPVEVIPEDVPPTAMTLSNRVIGVGNITSIVPTFTPANAKCELTYISSDTRIVVVAEDGRIKGKRIGKAKIYVLTDNGILASCVVRVKAAPRKVSVVASSAKLGVHQTLDVEAELPDGTGGTVTFTTSDAAVATVDEKGVVTAQGVGACIIRATTYNGKVAKMKVTVVAEPTSLTVVDEMLSLGVGQKQYLNWSLDNGQNASAITFTSDNSAVAIVTSSGQVKARKQGIATITITAYNGLQKEVDIVVLSAPTSMKVGPTSITLYAKQVYTIPIKLNGGSAASISYASSRSSIAKAYASGVIYAKRAGTATITVTTHNGIKNKIYVRVKNAPTRMSLNVTSGTLGVGDSFRLKPSFNSGAGAEMTYTSSNATIATVDASGTVTGKKAGTVTITAKTHNGLSKTCELVICPAPTSLTVADVTIELGLSQKYWINPVVKDTEGHDYAGRVFYESSSTRIATVSSSGKIIARRTGTVTITISTYNGLVEKRTVTVKNKPTGISLNKTSGTLPIGEHYQLVYQLRGTNAGGGVTFASSNPFICKVDETGYLTGVSAGTAVITVTTYNGYKAKCYVKVQ